MNRLSAVSRAPRRPCKPLRTSLRLTAAAVAACFVVGAQANPVAPTVVNGSASFNQSGNILTVTNSNGAIINWQQFNIAAGETTHFAQPSASSSVLNRVLGGDPSAIYGTLSSNGHVWLVNPAGILVGPGARIDVAGFVGSTLNISNADFLAGRLNFSATPGAGSVVNQGEITTPTGGSVYLIGSNVSNEGLITTPQGETILAAGQTVQLIDTATPGVKVEITGAEGNATNLGRIVAEAGRIGIAGVIARNSGVLNASSAISEGGRIFLRASQDAYVDGNGRITTTGTTGGRVEVLGNRVAVMDNAGIDASGENGGGTILVGGDYQGKNPCIQNASITYFGPNATLKADAKEVGAGGTVIVWANDTTRAFGTISACGGASGGNGGFVETSGKNFLAVDGIRVDTRAPRGTTGTWLLDPDELTILNGSGTGGGYNVSYGGDIFTTTTASSTIYAGTVETALSSTSVTLETSGAYGGNGNITATGVSINSAYAGNSLTLAAYGGGSATGNISLATSNFSVYGGVTLLAGWDGSGFTSGNVISGKGDIAISGSLIQSGGGGINLWAGHDIALSSSGTVGSWVQGTAMDVFAGHDLTLTGGSTASGPQGPGVMLYSTGTQTVYAGNQILLTADSADNTVYAGDPFYGGSVGIEADGDQTITAATIKLAAGTAGHDNAAVIHGSGSSQTINVTTLLDLKGGGGGTNNFASIHATGTSGNQAINVYGGSIVLTGGASGGAFNQENGAGIELSESNMYGGQTVYAGSITINGGGNASAFGGAGFGAHNGLTQTFTVTGDLTMNGGAGNNADFRATPAYIGSEYGGGTINVNVGGNINLNGGTGTAGGVLIGSLDDSMGLTSVTLNAGGDIAATPNTGGVWLGVKNPTGVSNSVNLTAGGNITLDRVGAGANGTIDVTAGGAILDGNGSVVNLKAGTINLTSVYGGATGGLAISSDVDNSDGSVYSLYATVNWGAGYGGISLRVAGDSPANIGLEDNAVSQNSIYFSATNDINLDGNQYFYTSNDGPITLFAGRDVWITGEYDYTLDTGGSAIVSAARDLTVDYDIYGNGGSLALIAGRELHLTSSAYISSYDWNDLLLAGGTVRNESWSIGAGNDLDILAGSLINTGQFSAGHDLTFIAGNVTADGGGEGGSFYAGNDINGFATGNIALDNYARMIAGNDIRLTLTGAASQLSLSNYSYLLADTVTGIAGTIYLDFLGRNSGGIFLDGAETTTSPGANGSGFFEVNYGDPAMPGSTLFVTYSGAGGKTNDAILAILNDNLQRAGETEEERRKRLQQSEDNGEHHDPADKPVAHCS